MGAYFYCIASTSGRTVFKRFQLLNCNILRHACPIVSETLRNQPLKTHLKNPAFAPKLRSYKLQPIMTALIQWPLPLWTTP